MEIRRDEQREERRKKGQKEDEEQNPQSAWEDVTAVSVRALRVFLEDLLAASEKKQKGGGISNTPAFVTSESPPPENQGAVPTPATQAAQAYQNTVRRSAGNSELHDQGTQNRPAPTTAQPQLTTEEMRVIHQLITDLGELSRRGVESLTILRGESFLESLAQAVHLAKDNP